MQDTDKFVLDSHLFWVLLFYIELHYLSSNSLPSSCTQWMPCYFFNLGTGLSWMNQISVMHWICLSYVIKDCYWSSFALIYCECIWGRTAFIFLWNKFHVSNSLFLTSSKMMVVFLTLFLILRHPQIPFSKFSMNPLFLSYLFPLFVFLPL